MKTLPLLPISLAALAGSSTILLMPQLPFILLCLKIILPILIVLGCWHYFNPSLITYLIIALLSGFLWTNFYASQNLEKRIPPFMEGTSLKAKIKIISSPENHKFVTNFDAKLLDIYSPPTSKTWLPATIRLSCYQCSNTYHVGDYLNTIIKLHAPRSTYNPASFDYEAWLFAHHFGAVGYLINISNINEPSHSYWSISKTRQHIYSHLQNALNKNHFLGLISALIIGERSLIAQEQWLTLQSTGTNHLFAIAGLHLGALGSASFWLGRFLWCRNTRFLLLLPAKQIGLFLSLISIVFYSALAGFSIPTQRAVAMTSLLICLAILKKNISPWQIYAYALLTSLAINPLNIMTDSFWLSFSAVAIILYGHLGRRSHPNFFFHHFRSQYLVMIGLLPFTLWFFHRFGWLSLVANALAIPWVLFLTLPCCLIGVLCLPISEFIATLLWKTASFSLSLLWPLLSWLAQYRSLQWQFYGEHWWQLALAIIGVFILFLPYGIPGRWLGVLWWLPMLLAKPDQPTQTGEYWLQLLDVGQGLSAIIYTQHHTLVFDTGNAIPGAMDMGESVVVPALLAKKRQIINELVISHPDSDHSGGLGAINHNLKIIHLSSSEPNWIHKKLLSLHQPAPNISLCESKQRWQWDGVNFEFLYPTAETLHQDNNSSCVLRIDNGSSSVLLPGDIEKKSERYLLTHAANQLENNLMVAPHHGSKTSSSENFVKTVHPQWVLYPIGYRNKFHFPHPKVVEQYQQLGAQAYDTANNGQILFKFLPASGVKITLERQCHPAFWRY